MHRFIAAAAQRNRGCRVVRATERALRNNAFIAKRTYRMFQLQSKIRGQQTALMEEAISGHKAVAAFSQEEPMLEKFGELNTQLQKASLNATFFSSLTNPSTRFVNSLVYAGVALVGAFSAIGGGAAAISVGTLSTFLAYANQYTKPFNEISGVVTELQGALASAARIFEVLDAPVEVPDSAGALVLDAPVFVVCLAMQAENLCKCPLGIMRIRSKKWITDITRT